MLHKRLTCLFWTLLLCLSCAAAVPPEVLESEYAILMCADTGEVLYEKNADEAARPASVTKLMTALLAFEQVEDFSQTTTVTAEALDVEYDSTRIGLLEGETVTLDDMIHAVLIGSANDAANVLAEAVGGSLEGFVQQMNGRMAELGCINSRFANAHGLDDDNLYVTARDIAVLTRELLKHPEFAEISSKQMHIMPANDVSGEERYINCRQSMLMPSSADYYEGAFAGKNGYTMSAGQTQVLCAERDGMTLIAVILKCPNKAAKVTDLTALLDHGFADYTLTTVTEDTLRELVEAGGFEPAYTTLSDLTLTLPAGTAPEALTVTEGPSGTDKLLLNLPDGKTALAALSYDEPEPMPPVVPVVEEPVVEEKTGFAAVLSALLAPENRKALLLGALGAGVLVAAVGGVFLTRAAKVRRNREELNIVMQRATIRHNDELERRLNEDEIDQLLRRLGMHDDPDRR